MCILCTYYSNYNNWVTNNYNPEPTPKPKLNAFSYLKLKGYSTFFGNTLILQLSQS